MIFLMEKISIEIDNTLSGIAGFQLGKSIYEKQIRPAIKNYDYKNGIEIVFAERIKRITSSFVQGFFSELMGKIGYYGIKDNVKVKTYSCELTESVYKVLE